MKKILVSLTFVLLICALISTLASCTVIGEILMGDGAHKHQHTEEITKAPTCTEAGEKTFNCSCGDKYTEAIEKLPHTEELLPAVAPTCTEAGLTEGKKCSACGEIILVQEEILALGHTEEVVAGKAATCTEKGLTEGKKCSVCGETLVAQEEIPMAAHTEEVVPGKAATCTATGLTDGKKCSVCGETLVAQEEIPMAAHTEEVVPGKAATCTATGLTDGKKCSVCDETLVAQEEIPMAAHTEEVVAGKAATCTETGLTDGKKCSVCGATLLAQEEIPMAAHTEEAVAGKDATCTETGLTDGKKCSVCGATLLAQENINALGHKDKNTDYECDVCGEDLCTEHVAGEAVEENRVEATCTTEGSYDLVVKCSVCGDEISRDHKVIPVIDHTEEVVPGKAATCTATGLTDGKKCSVCGATLLAQEEIPMAAHTEEAVAGKDATCTETGLTEGKKCSVCGAILLAQEEIPMAAHTEEAVPGKAATCTATGLTDGKKCSVCGATLLAQEEIPMATHTEEVVPGKAATCTATGLTDGKKCSVCGATLLAQEEIPMAAHTEEVVPGKAATCTETGLTDGKKCSVCGATLLAQEITEALEHDYKGVVTTAPTCTEEGIETFTCANCSDSYTEAVAASGHSYDNESDYVCNNCGFDKTAEYRLENGGFENGLEGWTVVGNIGNVSSDKNYWVNDPERAEGFEFGMDGNNMFSAYAPGALESAVGTLTSSAFKVGGSGFVTFKVGAMRDGNYVYVDVVDAETKQILARYYNGLWAERTDDVKSGCTLVAYKADLSAFTGKEVFFRISDNADSGYGLFFVDSFVTYYESEPEGFNVATPVDYNISGTIYDVFNGGFEMGDVQGWWNHGEIGVVTNANGYWGDNIPYEKVGDYLFTGVESFGADTMREGNRGALTSSVFEIGGTGWISFKLGGGGSALCYVQVIDAVTGEVLARYHQQAQRDAILIQYAADLSAYIGRTVRFQVVDQADSGWGCVSFDNLITYHTSKPEGLDAIDIKGELKYTIDNGSFESGNIDGWSMNITEAGAHNTLGWVESSEHDASWYAKNDDTKDGSFLFTFAKPDGTNCENSKGTLQSSTFSLKQGSFVSFKFGGAGGAQNHDVYIELCREDGSVIARFFNDAPGKVNTRMNSYFYQYNGPEVNCFFRVVDNSTGDYGCFVVDDFRVNLPGAPEGYIAAIQ